MACKKAEGIGGNNLIATYEPSESDKPSLRKSPLLFFASMLAKVLFRVITFSFKSYPKPRCVDDIIQPSSDDRKRLVTFINLLVAEFKHKHEKTVQIVVPKDTKNDNTVGLLSIYDAKNLMEMIDIQC